MAQQKPKEQLVDTTTGEVTDLARVHDYYPALTDQQREALKAWSQYDELISLPFVPRSAAAETHCLFTVQRVGEQSRPSIEDETQYVEQWVLLVEFDEDADLWLRNTGEPREFRKGDRALVAMPKSEGLRDQSMITLSSILAQHGALPGMYLDQLAPKKPGQSGAIVLRSAFDARHRGLKREEEASALT